MVRPDRPDPVMTDRDDIMGIWVIALLAPVSSRLQDWAAAKPFQKNFLSSPGKILVKHNLYEFFC